MAVDPERPKRVRLFVALDLPAPMRAAIAAWGRGALADPALRPVPEESLHITLAFLGWREPDEVERVAAVVRAGHGPAPRIELGQPEQRPLRGRARVYALPVRSEGAKALQAGLQGRLVEAGLYQPEKRPFWPHVTVARVRSERGRNRPPMEVRRPPGSLPRDLLQPRFCRRMTFYRSELQPEGARYVPLAQVELPGQGSSEVI